MFPRRYERVPSRRWIAQHGQRHTAFARSSSAALATCCVSTALGPISSVLRPPPPCATKVDMAADLPDNPISLLQLMASGDRDAFGRFYDRYASLAFTVALRLLGSRSDAEDLVQEVFLQGWHRAQSYSPERGSPEAWLITMRRSRGIDKLRSIRRRNMRTLAPDEPGRDGNGAQMEPPTDTSPSWGRRQLVGRNEP